MTPGSRILVSEAFLRRRFPGWQVPGIDWHRGTVDRHGDLIAIPQHGVNVDTAHLEPGDAATPCGWCLDEPATTERYATPSCAGCAAATRQERVARWSRAVSNRGEQA